MQRNGLWRNGERHRRNRAGGIWGRIARHAVNERALSVSGGERGGGGGGRGTGSCCRGGWGWGVTVCGLCVGNMGNLGNLEFSLCVPDVVLIGSFGISDVAKFAQLMR